MCLVSLGVALRSALATFEAHKRREGDNSCLTREPENFSSETAGLAAIAVSKREGHGAVDLLWYLDGLCFPCEETLRNARS